MGELQLPLPLRLLWNPSQVDRSSKTKLQLSLSLTKHCSNLARKRGNEVIVTMIMVMIMIQKKGEDEEEVGVQTQKRKKKCRILPRLMTVPKGENLQEVEKPLNTSMILITALKTKETMQLISPYPTKTPQMEKLPLFPQQQAKLELMALPLRRPQLQVEIQRPQMHHRSLIKLFLELQSRLPLIHPQISQDQITLLWM